MRIHPLCFVVFVSAAMAAPLSAFAAEPAEIYTGGNIVTMDPAQPSVEAVAVQAGRIVGVGTWADLKRAHGDARFEFHLI